VVNVGSVGNPVGTDTRACYAVLECGGSAIEITHRRVGYDMAAFEDALRRSRHPSGDYILAHARGRHPSRAPHADHAPLVPGEPVRLGRADAASV